MTFTDGFLFGVYASIIFVGVVLVIHDLGEVPLHDRGRSRDTAQKLEKHSHCFHRNWQGKKYKKSICCKFLEPMQSELSRYKEMCVKLAEHLEFAITAAENPRGIPWTFPIGKEDLEKAKEMLKGE